MRASRWIGSLLIAANVTRAQTVRLRLTDSTARPVVGALVSLIDSAGASRAVSLSDGTGAAILQPPEPGSYSVEVRQVGWAPFASDAMRVGANETVPVALHVASRREPLDTTRTDARSCSVTGDHVGAIPAWRQVRLALESAQLSRSLVAGQGHIRRFERWTTANGDIYHDTSFVGRGDRPFGTPNSERLEREGYVRLRRDGMADYFVPDSRVMLSDQFTQDHCFGMQPSDSVPSLIGLTFAPIRGRNQPDIAGTFWLARATGELQALDFSYVNVPNQPNRRAGGRVRFHHQDPGFWMVQSWRLRVPRMSAVDEPGYPLVFNGWYEFGAEALP